MLLAILDRGNVWVMNIIDDPDIDLDRLKKEWSKRYIAWFVNNEGTKDVLMGMPITRFVMQRTSNDLVEISREQAIQLLVMLDEFRKEKIEQASSRNK